MKKVKLFATIASLCLAVAVLCFGVFSATNITYTIGGTISYEVQDVFVKITTKVYTSNAQVDNADDLKDYANKFVNSTPTSLGESSVINLTEYNGKFDFNSLTNELDENDSYCPQSKIDMIFGEKTNAYSMYIVMNIVNLADSIVYTHINSFTNDIENVVGCTSDSDLRIFKTETNGQTIVLAYSLKDKKQGINISDFSFTLAMRCTEPYSYGQLSDISGGFLSTYSSLYSNKLKNIIFTNNSADFDIKSARYNHIVGKAYSNNNQYDIVAYTYQNGDMYDCYVYAPVTQMYIPTKSRGYFAYWFYYDATSIESDSYEISMSYDKIELIDLSATAVDTTREVSLFGFFHGCHKLKKIIGIEYWDTSSCTDFSGMFLGCDSLEELNLSNFSFKSVNNSGQNGIMATIGMLGVNDEYCKIIFGEANCKGIVNATSVDDKIYQLSILLNASGLYKGGYARLMAESAYNCNIAKFVAPSDIRGIIIGLPYGGCEYTIEGTTDTTNFLIAGKTLIRKS